MPLREPTRTSESQGAAAEPPDNPGVLGAVKTLLVSAGYGEEAIEQALCVLDGQVDDPFVEDGMLSARDVCEWLGISLSTLWRWKVPHVRVGGLRRFYRTDVRDFLDRRYMRGGS